MTQSQCNYSNYIINYYLLNHLSAFPREGRFLSSSLIASLLHIQFIHPKNAFFIHFLEIFNLWHKFDILPFIIEIHDLRILKINKKNIVYRILNRI